MENAVRLNKFIASNGILSRRKIDELILQGRVTVNGSTINELGYKINAAEDKVSVDGEPVKTSTKKIYIILNKPPGVITSVSDEKKRTTVIDLLKLNEKVFPVGRLDYNTTGLLLLTNDGELANKLMHPRNEIYKTYFVKLSKPLEEKHRIKLTEGVMLDDRKTAPSKIRYPKKNNNYQDLFISIYEGRNRQVRNMFENYGYFVRELERVEYAGLKIDNLRQGEWRMLTQDEVKGLYELSKDMPSDNTKRVHYAKRDEKKVYRKYKARDDKRDFRKDDKKDFKRNFRKDDKKDFKKNLNKPGKKNHQKDSKWGFKERQTVERDNKLGFKKIEAGKDKEKDVRKGFKKFGSKDERKYKKSDFKKSDKRYSKKFEKKDFKRFGKGDVNKRFKKNSN